MTDEHSRDVIDNHIVSPHTEGSMDVEEMVIHTSTTMQAGNAGTFLLKACTNGMSNERLVGTIPAPPPHHPMTDQTSSNDTTIPLEAHSVTSAKTKAMDCPQPQRHHQSRPYQNLVTISTFMADYKARKTIAEGKHKRRGSDSRIIGLDDEEDTIATRSLEPDADYYSAAIHDFAQTQMSRQSAGLGKNANEASADGLHDLVRCHSAALNSAILHAESERNAGPSTTFRIPNKRDLCSWHSLLCPHQSQSGRYRSGEAHAGNTVFCPPLEIDQEMDAFASAMEKLYSKWSNQILVGTADNLASAGPQAEQSLIVCTYYSVALAAVLLYGILDIHCFTDGNGRMGRICTNWMLRRLLGLPFTVVVTANPSQRVEYISCLKSATRWILSLEDIDPINPDFPMSVTHGQHSSSHIEYGIFQDLIHMLLDRIAHACYECQRIIGIKSQAATASEEARIAREVRERASAEQCCICLEEHPNILTICCGQATHLNCLAEWLGTASNCVACRQPLPTLQVRQPQPIPDNSAQTIMESASQQIQPINSHTNPRNDVWNRVLTNMLWEAAESVDDAYCYNEECTNRAAIDCPNHMCRVCCQSYGDMECSRHGDGPQSNVVTTSTTTTNHNNNGMSTVVETLVEQRESNNNNGFAATTTTTTLEESLLSGLPYCRLCSNRAAMDCENRMCGRHCVLHGWYGCIRHNTQ